MWALPWPWMPATPTRITSLAPSTRPDALVPAIVTSGNVAPAAAVLRKCRRESFFMTILRDNEFPGMTPPSFDRFQVRQQVGHGRHVDFFLQPLRHKGQPRAPQLVDV